MFRVSKAAILSLAVCAMGSIAAGQTSASPMSIYILPFQTDIKGDNKKVVDSITRKIRSAFGKRSSAFRMLERSERGQLMTANDMEQDLQRLASGDKPSQRLVGGVEKADGFVSGELLDGVGGITLTVSVKRLNFEIKWQEDRTHSLLEWLDPRVQEKEAESLAAGAAAALLPPPPTVHPGPDSARGIQLAGEGHCREAMPFLKNAAVIDTDNAELFFQMGRCENVTEEFDMALNSLKKALSLRQRADIFTERARSYFAKGYNRQALDDLNQALGLDKGSLPAIELRGDIWMKTGDSHDAVGAFYEVYQKDPSRERCKKLANALRKDGTSDSASLQERSCASLP